ncbi:MAG TPA: hypothetical protein VJH90_02990 [archaeon]|nr:hypothetical protein [archaeon]
MGKIEFMKPGKTNREDRINFVKFWAKYIRTHRDEEWSEQRNILIDSQMQYEKRTSKESPAG